jgi:uncharacterized membrane protein YebE (DUF533 family)
MNRPSDSEEVNVEIVKLLLQVAWADDTLDDKERAAVATLCKQWKVPDETTAFLLQHLHLGKPLPQPNMALLKQHRHAAIAAAEWFIGIDGVVDDAEKDFVNTIEQLLS